MTPQNPHNGVMPFIAPKLGRRAALVVASIVLLAPTGQAQVPYRINGIKAPQVQPNPVAAKLEAQLNSVKAELEARATTTNLQQAIEAGLLNNPSLAETYAQIQGSQWNLIAVRRQWYPSLTLSPGAGGSTLAQGFSTTTTAGPSTNGSNATTYRNATDAGVTFSLGWTFFDPSRGAQINAAGESLKQQQLLFDVSARQLVLDIQQAYFNLQEQSQLITAYRDILAGSSRQVDLTEAQFNNGLASIADVEQIRTQQYSTLSTLINAYRQLLVGSARLAQTMALPPGTLVLPADGLRAQGSWDQPLQATIAQALALREEIKASLAGAASASWAATGLFNAYWPVFSLGTSGTYDSANTTGGQPGASLSTNSRSLSWNGGVGIGFNWALFDGGIKAANAEASRAQARQLNERAAFERLTVSREVEEAYTSYLTSQLGMQSAAEQARAARQAAVAVLERFSVGATDMNTVVTTLNAAILAANAYATAVRSYNSAVATLYRSSARWPDGTQTLLEQRVGALKRQ